VWLKLHARRHKWEREVVASKPTPDSGFCRASLVVAHFIARLR
jgi:hypothetical protein